jgi:hypothetical protein
MNEWQPIETTWPPRDGTRILLTDGDNVFVGYWTGSCEFGGDRDPVPGWQIFKCDEDYWYSYGAENATHWMPLPEPPK